MRKHIEFSIGALLFGCVVAACSGGGTSSLPAAPHGGGGTQAGQQNVAFTITVPPASAAMTRTPKYVSSSTQSVSIVETDNGGSPSPAVVQNTTPGSSNCTTGTAGTACTITVLANAGSDSFTVKTFDQPSAAGNLLASGTVQGTVVAGKANTFPLTLGGTVASLALVTSQAYPQVAGTTTISAQAKDAGGNVIIGPYDSSIAVSTSASATLSASTLASSSDSITVTLGASQTTSFAIAGTANGHSGSVMLNPSSGIVYYPIGQGSTDTSGFQIFTGTDGKLYYSTLGPLVCTNNFCASTTGHIGQFDPATGTDAEIAVNDEPVGLYQTSDGAVWSALTSYNTTTGAKTGYVGHLTGAFTAANLNTIPLPTPSPNNSATLARSFALGSDGNLYLTGNADHQLYKIPVSNPSTATIAAIPLPRESSPPGSTFPGSSLPMPEGIAAGPDGNLYIANFSFVSANVLQYAPSTQTVTPFEFPGSPQQHSGRYVVAGPDANMYVSATANCALSNTDTSCSGGLYQVTTSGTLTALALPDLQSWPDFLAAGSTMIAFADLGDSALGTYTPSTGDMRTYPLQPYTAPCCDVALLPNAVAFTSDGSMWTITYGLMSAGGHLGIGHVVLTGNWSVWPSQNITLAGTGAAGEQLIGIMESGDSGPFTLTSSNSSIAMLQAITGKSHDFELVGSAPGSCTVTITDKNGRSASIAVSVTSTGGTVQVRRSRASSNGGVL